MADLSVMLPLLASLVLTPVVMNLWQRHAPPADRSEFDSLGAEVLAQRNGMLNSLFTALMFVGLFVPVILITLFPPSSGVRAFGLVALQFGLMVDLPVAAVAAITMRSGGVRRFQEFWRFYELKYGIGLRSIAWVYTPIGLLAPIGLVMVALGA